MFEWVKSKSKRLEFYERLGLYLLYAYILSLAANPFIMLAVGLDKFNYVVVESPSGAPVILSQLPAEQKEILSKYRVVDQAYVDKMKSFQNYIEWISITALLGWIATSPRFQRGWPKLVKKFSSSEKITFK